MPTVDICTTKKIQLSISKSSITEYIKLYLTKWQNMFINGEYGFMVSHSLHPSPPPSHPSHLMYHPSMEQCPIIQGIIFARQNWFIIWENGPILGDDIKQVNPTRFNGFSDVVIRWGEKVLSIVILHIGTVLLQLFTIHLESSENSHYSLYNHISWNGWDIYMQ